MADTVHRPLFSNQEDVSKRLQLKRHTGTHDKRYRLVLLATKEQPKRPSQKESKCPVCRISVLICDRDI